MKRGESYGGGQSSLGYLFSSDDHPNLKTPPPPKPAALPPYGVDSDTMPEKAADSEKQNVSGNYPRPQGQISGNFITDRPSTKVKSVPGGDSSLGYLFGDK